MTEKINKGCEFQSDCIEYKDISYLKVMPICAIYELSIACHHKVDRCKYYKLYKQLKRLEQENEKYHKVLEEIRTYLNILSSIDNDFPNTETYLRIQDKINEVLQ